MPLLFLITYIAISYFIYKKNKTNIEKIPLILQLTWLIAFALLFVYIVYYSELSLSTNEELLYLYSFYFLVISYFITFIVFFFNYKSIIKISKTIKKVPNNIWKLENILNKIYFIIIFILWITYFLYTKPLDIDWWEWIQVIFYMFFIFSSIYILFEKKLLL